MALLFVMSEKLTEFSKTLSLIDHKMLIPFPRHNSNRTDTVLPWVVYLSLLVQNIYTSFLLVMFGLVERYTDADNEG